MSASYDDIPEPEPVGEYVCALPAEAEAEFLSPNIVPLERFTYGGDVVIKTDEAPALYFDFSTDGKTGEIELFMPLSCKTVTESVALDGIELTSHAAKVFDEVISEKECTTPER